VPGITGPVINTPDTTPTPTDTTPPSAPFAYFDAETSTWRSAQPSLQDGDEPAVKWPSSGGWTAAGLAYTHEDQPPTPEKFPLLPTPRVSMKNGAPQKEVDAGDPKKRIEVAVLMLPRPELLPNPAADAGECEPAVLRHAPPPQPSAEGIAVPTRPEPDPALFDYPLADGPA
jgi:hypothetical protein